MKLSKKALVLLLTLVMALGVGLTGCQSGGGDTTPKVPAVESVEITNTTTTITAGDTVVTAKTLPEGANQEFTATLDAPVYGVKFDEASKTIKVNAGAKTGDSVSITVKSVADPTKTVTKAFSLNIVAPTYVEISTYEQLIAIGSSKVASAKSYKLTSNIAIKATNAGGDVTEPVIWAPWNLPFTGLLDGNGFSIKGINMPSPSKTNPDKIGFFRENQGVIRNLGFDNSENKDMWMNVGANSAVVAGKNSGAISNVWTKVPLATAGGYASALVGENTGFIENSYALGATVANDTAGKASVIGKNTGSVKGVVADKQTTGLTSFYGDKVDASADLNLLTSVVMQTTATYTSMAWDTEKWYFTNVYPILKTPTFAEGSIKKTLEITTPGVIELADLSLVAGKPTLALALNKTNSQHDAIEWVLETPVAGVTISPETGIVTIDAVVDTTVDTTAGAMDGTTFTVIATIAGATRDTSKVFTIRNDGYKSSVGIVVSTYADMYNVFFKTAGETADAHERNISRIVKLGANITLPALGDASIINTAEKDYANWPGVADYHGTFDGQGYAIKGLAVTAGKGHEINVVGDQNYDGNASYGFFRRVGKITYGGIADDGFKGKGEGSGTIKNVALTDGYIHFEGNILNGGAREVGGLVQMLGSGLIDNVLVDLEITTNTVEAGIIVGSMGGTADVTTAKKVGTATLSNSIAMGKITSTCPEGAQRRPNIAPVACGALVGYTKTDGAEIINCYARGAKGEDIDLTTRTPEGLLENSARIDGIGFKSIDEFQLASTFTALPFDTNLWAFKDGSYPMLKFPGFVDGDQPVAPSSIEISNKKSVEAFYELLDYTPITLTTTVINPKGKTVVYSATVGGVANTTDIAISPAGVITLNNTIADGAAVVVKATLGTETDAKSDTVSFTVYNDGYTAATGVQITTEQQLFDALIGGNETTVSRNMHRTIKLMNDITLTTHANWPGVSKTFSGNFNGQGYAIKGLNISTANGKVGFFLKTDSRKALPVIENLSLEGTIVKTGNKGEGDANAVGALVAEHRGGLIKNVRVDVDLTADECDWTGKIVGYMNGDVAKAEIQNCIAMGTITAKHNTDPKVDPANPDVNQWQHYAVGALMGKTEGGNLGAFDSYAIAFPGAKQVGLTIRNVNQLGGKLTGSAYIKVNEAILVETYANFDKTIWKVAAGQRPVLIHGTLADEPANIEMLTPDKTYTFKSMTEPEKTISITTETCAAPVDSTIKYSLVEAVANVTINETTGVVTIGAITSAQEADVVVKVKAEIMSSANPSAVLATSGICTLTFLMDSYDATVGVQIANEQQLYDALIGDGSPEANKKVGLNMTRNLKLTADIVLSTHANWPGVANTFSGNFDGQGHTISGFAVTDTNNGYGFFTTLRATNKTDVLVQNLGLGLGENDTITYTNGTGVTADGSHYVGALAKEITCGTVKNVLVNMKVHSSRNYVGKVIGYVNGQVRLESCIAMGTIDSDIKTPGNNIGSSGLKDWESYACGAFIAKSEAGADVSGCYVLGVENLSSNTWFTNRKQDQLVGTFVDYGFKSDAEMKTTTALTGMDVTAWTFSATELPKLKVAV